MRTLELGFLLRYNHINGCALLFIVLYLHMFRTIYHNSYHKSTVWLIGIISFLLLCAISFTGYSLVYGQMSLWAIVVICSLVTAIPFVGEQLLTLLWGGTMISDVTLQRIFSLHYLLPLLCLLNILLHLFSLHIINSTGDHYSLSHRYDRINFYPLLLIRDIFIGTILIRKELTVTS